MVQRYATAAVVAVVAAFSGGCGSGDTSGAPGWMDAVSGERVADAGPGDVRSDQGVAEGAADDASEGREDATSDSPQGEVSDGGETADSPLTADETPTPDRTTDAAQCTVGPDCQDSMGPPPPCFAWVCAGGACVKEALDDGAPCDDESACTTGDACDGGECRGAAIACEDDGDPCTAVACDPASGCGHVPVTGAACDDGDACTGGDQCILGQCKGEEARCDDGDLCTADSCDPLSGCIHDPATGPACDDLDECTHDDTCQEGGCAGAPVGCDDGNPCTQDGCDPASGCTHDAFNGNPCHDGSVCTGDDHCKAGQCIGTPLSCNDGNPCTGDACDPDAGCLHPPSDGAWCNDGNPCTDEDRCVQGVCVGQATGCDDGNPCTVDSCTSQSGCIHMQVPGLPCDDGDPCTTGDHCYKGSCVPGSPVDCDDGDQCTADSCDPASGCLNVALTGTPCDDGNACTAGDLCAQGRCAGSPVACDDANPCTGDTCDPAVGCVYIPLAVACDDGDPCTAGDHCDGGQCHAGTNPQCLAVKRVVLAGDSWSTGLIYPLRDALDARGYEEVAVSWELTSKPGSTVAGWLSDSSLMAGLFLSLDADPPAGILFFTLGGNDYLHACQNGLGLMDAVGWFVTMTQIQWNLQTFLALVEAGRPNLKVVLIGYDYLNYFMIQAAGFDFPGLDLIRFNLGMVDLAMRGRDVAAAAPNMVYAHNMGLLQYTFGDPMFGYGPGVAPKPGPAPAYNPFPGGWFTYPSPLAHIPDGIHPDYAGFRAIIENTLDQGPAAWIGGTPWP